MSTDEKISIILQKNKQKLYKQEKNKHLALYIKNKH